MAHYFVKSSRVRADSVIVFRYEASNVPVHVVHDVEREDSVKENQEDNKDDVADDRDDEGEQVGIHLESVDRGPRGKTRYDECVRMISER